MTTCDCGAVKAKTPHVSWCSSLLQLKPAEAPGGGDWARGMLYRLNDAGTKMEKVPGPTFTAPSGTHTADFEILVSSAYQDIIRQDFPTCGPGKLLETVTHLREQLQFLEDRLHASLQLPSRTQSFAGIMAWLPETDLEGHPVFPTLNTLDQ